MVQGWLLPAGCTAAWQQEVGWCSQGASGGGGGAAYQKVASVRRFAARGPSSFPACLGGHLAKGGTQLHDPGICHWNWCNRSPALVALTRQQAGLAGCVSRPFIFYGESTVRIHVSQGELHYVIRPILGSISRRSLLPAVHPIPGAASYAIHITSPCRLRARNPTKKGSEFPARCVCPKCS